MRSSAVALVFVAVAGYAQDSFKPRELKDRVEHPGKIVCIGCWLQNEDSSADAQCGNCGPEATAVLEEHPAEMQVVLVPEKGGTEVVGEEIRWWTFAGGRINSTLRYALETVGGDWKVVTDNSLVKVTGKNLTPGDFRVVLRHLQASKLWEDEKLWSAVAKSLPNYRISKLQPLMPDWVQREVIAAYLLDIAGARRWLERALKRKDHEVQVASGRLSPAPSGPGTCQTRVLPLPNHSSHSPKTACAIPTQLKRSLTQS